MANKVKKDAPKAEPKKEEKPKVEKVISSKRIGDKDKKVDRSSFATVEGVLTKDHGNLKKGETISRHPNTMDMLKAKGIVK